MTVPSGIVCVGTGGSLSGSAVALFLSDTTSGEKARISHFS